ncbi:MAG: DUF692 domain-containing protein [Myxococcales bacterium]
MFDVPALGHGIGLRPTHYAQLLETGAREVDWFEAISENFFEEGGRPLAVLDRVRLDAPVVLHGVAMNLGGADDLSEDYLARLARLVARVDPAWVSDHLCWGSAAGQYAHDLLPVPYTEEALSHVVARIQRVQERLGRAILVENISAYVAFRESAIPEWQFLNELHERTGCGILLDVNNVYVTSKNLGFDAEAYVRAVRPSAVGQIHLAGHTEQPDFILDSHVGPVPDPVWELYRLAVRCFGRVSTLVEWDEAVPALPVVLAETARAREIEREVLS